MELKEIYLIDELIEKKKAEIISYSTDESGLAPQVENIAKWDRAKDELNMLDKINSILFAHKYMVENSRLDLRYIMSKLTSGTAKIFYRIDEVGRNVVHFTVKDELDSEEVIAELSLAFADSECYLSINKAPERGDSRKAIKVLESKKTAHTIYNRGIFIAGEYYYSDDFAELLGRNVLVTDPVDGSVEVFSTEGKHLTTAFIQRIRHEGEEPARSDLENEMIKGINLEIEIPTHKDMECMKKMCFDCEIESLSGKELKELVNKWIVYHAKNDTNLSPGYFNRLLRSWETIYRRQCGMSMLDTF